MPQNSWKTLLLTFLFCLGPSIVSLSTERSVLWMILVGIRMVCQLTVWGEVVGIKDGGLWAYYRPLSIGSRANQWKRKITASLYEKKEKGSRMNTIVRGLQSKRNCTRHIAKSVRESFDFSPVDGALWYFLPHISLLPCKAALVFGVRFGN